MELILKKLDRLEEDMHGLKEDMHGLKGDMHDFKDEMHDFKDSQAKMESDIKALRADSRETQRRLDGLSAKVDLTWRAVSELSADGVRLDRLQKRVEIIEKKCGMIS